jgi:hypothetical protein
MYLKQMRLKINRLVSIEAEKRPLLEILAEISSQTQWTMVVDVRLADKTVSGNFQEVDIESFLKRSLKGENLIVLYNEENKSVDIRSFGAAKAMLTITPNPLPDKENQGKLQAMWKAEEKAYEEYLAHPDSVEPLTGVKLGSIRALHEAENKAYEEYITSPDAIEPLTGVKLSSIKALHEAENKAYEEYIASPDAVEPLTGVKLSSIRATACRRKQSVMKNILAKMAPIELICGGMTERRNRPEPATRKERPSG